jgi:hypothetical protein
MLARSSTLAMLLALIIVSSACAPPMGMLVGSWTPRPAVLHLETEGGLTALDATTGETKFALTQAIAAPGGARLFRVSHESDGTRVETLRGEDGALIGSHAVPDVQAPLVASPRGRLVALGPSAGVAGSWLAPGREWSTLTIADVERGTHRAYRLQGNYAPEAFSLRDDRLFLVEYLPAHAPDRYRVRQLDLTTGDVLPVGGRNDKALAAGQSVATVEEEMRGRSRMHIMAPNHSFLYTLYVHDEDHLHRRDAPELGGLGRPDPNVHAFVHVLSLADGWAYCLDLPAQFGLGPSDNLAVALSADGKRLHVADLTAGRMAIADTEQLRIVETLPLAIPASQGGSPVALRVARHGLLVVATGETLTVLDRRGTVRSQTPLTDPVRAMELATDGRRVFILGSTGLTVLKVDQDWG